MSETPQMPPIGPLVSKGVYHLCYYLSFGAVYAGEIAVGLLPAESVIRHGLRDGAEAAHHAWYAKREEHRTAEDEMALPPDADLTAD